MSTRTAGFNSFDMSLTNDYTNIICGVLMFIGGGPASTAGGIKITTFILSLMMIFSHLKGKENISFSGRDSIQSWSKVISYFGSQPLYCFIYNIHSNDY